jgi:hypothetical protein
MCTHHPSQVKSIAIIGSNGGTGVTIGGGGSGSVRPTYVISPLAGITERAARGPGPLPTKSNCTTRVGGLQLTGSYVGGSAVHALRTGVMSATECCNKCFGDDGCSFYTYTNATSTTSTTSAASAASETNGAMRSVLSGTTEQGGMEGHASTTEQGSMEGHASLSIQSADDVVLSGGAVREAM